MPLKLAIVALATGLYFTFTRSAWIGAGAGVAFVLVTQIRRRETVPFALAGLFGVAAILLATGGLEFLRVTFSFSEPSSRNHLRELWDGTKYMLAHPLGIGIGKVGRAFLRFIHGILDEFREAEAFLFHTRLAHVSDAMKEKDAARALDRLSIMAQGAGGGTRIGESLQTFNRWHAARVIHSRTVVMIVSDGYETGDAALLGREMAALGRVSSKMGEQILEEFHQTAVAAEHVARGDIEFAKRVLIKSFGPDTARRRAFFANLFHDLHGQALHAQTLGFTHPATGRALDFEAPLPPGFAGALARLRSVEPGG